MKTKVDKKGKKRSLSETSLSAKSTQKQENVSESKKSPKKAKLATSVQNGNSTTQNKVQILKKMYKQKEKQKTKQINIGQPLKAKIKTEETKQPTAKLKEESVSKKIKTKENKVKILKKKQAKRELQKKKRRRLNAASITLSIEEIEAKIEEIRNREVLSKRAKKILSVLNRKLKYEKSANNLEKLNVMEKKSKDQINALVKIKQEPNEDNEEKIKVKEENVQQDNEDKIKKANVRNIRLYMKHNDLNIKSELDDSDDQDDSEDDEDESDEDDEDDINEKANILKGKKEDIKKMKKQVAQSLEHQNKNQYVLFVSNFSLKVTEDELKQHFLTKVDRVANVMMPCKPNVTLPYGFAFVELTNSTDFKKGLSMNHSLLRERPLMVEVIKSNDKEINIVKNHVKAKNKNPPAFKEVKKINFGQNQQKKKLLKKEK